ncbi:MAG: tetratricopeptide repeat protein [Paludibacteraceae bacterium]|nr:tetratricopeptide repeat protein [Paludibacteraceae bacterium]
MSRKNKNFESKRTELIERFETSSNSAYFDVEEFEIIIEYYLNFFDTESAEKALKIAFALHPNNPELLIKKSVINFYKEDFNAALQCLKNFPNPDDTEMLFWKGKALVELDYIDEACECFETIAEMEQDDELFDDLCLDIAQAFHNERFRQISIDWLQKGYAFNKKNCELINYYAFQCTFLNRNEEAIKLLNESLDLNPYQSAVWVQLCENLLQIGKHNEAMEAIDFAVLLDKESYIIWKTKGELLCDIKEVDEAIDCFSKAKDCAISLSEKSECYFLLATCFEEKRDYKNALSCYQENIRLNMMLGIKDSESLLGCAFSMIRLEKYEDGLKICDEITNEFPDIEAGWFYKGEILFEFDRIDEATDCLLKFMEIGENQELLLSVVDLLGKKFLENENFENALKIYNKGVQINKNDDKIKLLLSVTHYKLNNKTKAFEILKELAGRDTDAIPFFTDFCPEAKEEINLLLK